jgi:hypothetical protein
MPAITRRISRKSKIAWISDMDSTPVEAGGMLAEGPAVSEKLVPARKWSGI